MAMAMTARSGHAQTRPQGWPGDSLENSTLTKGHLFYGQIQEAGCPQGPHFVTRPGQRKMVPQRGVEPPTY